MHNAARSIFGFSHAGLVPDFSRIQHVVLYGRNIVESLMVKEVKAFMAALGSGMRCTYIDPRASATAAKATRFWQVRPNSDYALNLALIHEVLRQKAYDEDFVERWVTGMDVLREAVKDTTPDWQEPHTGVPARELREFVAEIAGQAPHVIFNPGWMTARHKQSFYVSRTALILNALMGNLETPGGFILAKGPEYYGRKSLKPLAARAPAVTEPRVDGAGTTHPTWDPAIGMLHQLFAAMETAQPYGIGAYIAYRHDPRDRDARRRGGQAGAGQGRAGRLHRRALFRDGLVLRRHPARIDLPGARQHPGPAARPGAGVHDARPGHRAALRQPPGVVDLPRDPAPHGQDGSAGLRDHRGALELPARRHRRHRGRHARVGRRRAWPRRRS